MVVVFGSVNLDLVARVARIPAPGETLTGASFAQVPGGKGANQALAARRAGAEVAFYGAIGRDPFGDVALANLVAAGVRIDGVVSVAAPTGVALINVADSGENAITVIPGANASVRAEQVPDSLLDPRTTVALQLEVPIEQVERLAARAKSRGARVVLNAAPASALSPSLLGALDVLVVNEHEAALLAAGLAVSAEPQAFAAAVSARFGTAVVVTLGAQGALAVAAHDAFFATPPAVAVVDTTGAGDACVGALVAAIDGGRPLRRALAEGIAAGALACMRHGAQAAAADGLTIGAYADGVESGLRATSLR